MNIDISTKNGGEHNVEKLIVGNVDMADPDVLKVPSFIHRRTPFIVSLTDPTLTSVDIQNMMEAGMNVARLRVSHNSQKVERRLLQMLAEAAKTCCQKYKVVHWPIATCITLKTYVTLTGYLANGKKQIYIKEGTEIELTCDEAYYDICDATKIYVDYIDLSTHWAVGNTITVYLFDEIVLKCIEIVDKETIKCVVVSSGNLHNMCFVSVRGLNTTLPSLNKQDIRILKMAKANDVDIIIVFYPMDVELIKKVRRLLGSKSRQMILAGICTPLGLKNVDEILHESDGIIFGREFLTYEIEPAYVYRLPQIQKWVSGKCKRVGKPFIVSGGIMQNALIHGEFRDNEIANVSSGIFDGVTGFQLKDYSCPENVMNTLKVMSELARCVEPLSINKDDVWRMYDETMPPANAAEGVALACSLAAVQTGSKAVILPTVSGRTVRALLKNNPAYVILTVSTDDRVSTLLHVYKSCLPLVYREHGHHKKFQDGMQARILYAVEYAVKRGILSYGDMYVTLQRGTESSAYCDTVQICTVAITNKPLVECDYDDEN